MYSAVLADLKTEAAHPITQEETGISSVTKSTTRWYIEYALGGHPVITCLGKIGNAGS